jgi:hypothetical protein
MHIFNTYYHEQSQYFPCYQWIFTFTNSQVREGFSHLVHYNLALVSGRSTIKYRRKFLTDGYFFFTAPPLSLALLMLKMAASKADKTAMYTEDEL